MKYLDEQIYASAASSSIAMAGVYTYKVSRKNDSNNTYTVIFVGNMYRVTGWGFTVDITDIVRNDVWVPTEGELYQQISQGGTKISVKLINTYKVDFVLPSSVLSTPDIQVAKAYRYPHYIKDMQNEVYFDHTSETSKTSILMQGKTQRNSSANDYVLPAHYPLVYTDNYRLLMSTEIGSSVSSKTLAISNGMTLNRSLSINAVFYPSFCYAETIKGLLETAQCSTRYGTDYGSVIQKSTPAYNLTAQQNTLVISSSASPYTAPYYKIVLYKSGARYYKDYTGWLPAEQDNVTELTVDQEFYDAARDYEGGIYILFSKTESTSVGFGNYDRVYWNLESLPSSIVGKNIIFHSNVYYDDENTWNLNAPTIGVRPQTNPKIDFNGDYFAVLDACPDRFYLQWQDRMGGFQSQPFNKYYTYKESFKSQTITDYKGIKKVSNVEVVPKFTISTDWIDEQYYPYYESIFTSPVLFLYDTEEDHLYSVIVKNSEFDEKRYDNNRQHKLFNLTLNLELNKNQTIIY